MSGLLGCGVGCGGIQSGMGRLFFLPKTVGGKFVVEPLTTVTIPGPLR